MKQPLTPEQCQANAAECDLKAREARDPDITWQFRDLAKQWRQLAALRATMRVAPR